MSCELGYENISIEELEKQLDDAKKSLVDKKYKNYDSPEHLFNYNINFDRFLADMSYILDKAKNVENVDDRYQMA